MTDLGLGLDYLYAQGAPSLLALFWYVVIFDVPRYLMLFGLTAFVPPRRFDDDYNASVSVVIAGHSEADAIERCVLALREQSRPPDQIVVVSDGSQDDMRGRMRELMRRGLIDQAHATDLRSGKSAGVNMALRHCTGKILINVDCDCTFDRHALRNILRPFVDNNVAAVCGSIQTRNTTKTMITRFQAIEYLISISMGRQSADRINQVTCVAGAFGAFRRNTLVAQGGLDAGGGEDLDLTLRLRQAGWTIRFAENAVCYTDVPETLRGLVRQRFRWERDAVRLRYRKHAGMMNPWSARFRLSEVFNEVEFLLFNVIGAIAMPFYIIWLAITFGTIAIPVLIAAQFGLLIIDGMAFLLAAAVSRSVPSYRLILDLPGYSLFSGVFMRMVRLTAYFDEWVFKSSYSDEYVPKKVHDVRG